LHCIIPAGGITVQGNWQPARGNGSFLFPVKALSLVFRAKFRDGLKQVGAKSGFEVPQELQNRMNKSAWVVYAKAPFAGPKQVIEYLGRYTHRVAISNHRIESVKNGKVSFKYKDYCDENKQKLMILDATEFLRRFCLHILPQRFVKIRHYGFLSSRRKAAELPVLQGKVNETGSTEPLQPTKPKQKLSWQEISRKRLNFDPDVCPCCQKGRMRTIEILPPRSPPNMIKNQQQTNRK
jgi:hypothetical protein